MTSSTTAPSARHAAAPAATLRSDDPWLFRYLPLHLVIPVALVAIAASLVTVALHIAWWGVAAAAAVPAVAGLLIGRRLGRWTAFRWRQMRHRDAEEPTLIDAPLPEGGSYGLQWDGTSLTTMLRIDPPPDTLTMLRRGSLSTDQLLPLTEIASCLLQFDIELDSIDVVSTGTRTASNEAVLSGYAATVVPLARMYDEILGPLPAIAHRTVWIVLRLDPLANAKAVGNRGGGSDGALRTATAATRRVANRLAARGITASVLTASEMNSALRELTRGIPVEEYTETAKSLEFNGVHLVNYRIDSELINARGLARVWAVPSLATTVAVRLRPAERTPGESSRTLLEVDARVRYDLPRVPDQPPIEGLHELPRRQSWALLDSLPLGVRPASIAGYRGPLEALEGFAVPTSGCGQLIGADETGRGIAVPLIGSGSRRIDIVGSLMLAQQVILRAIALGAAAVVYTNRPGAWQAMIAGVGNQHALSLASSVTQSLRHNTVPGGRLPLPAATLVVFDGVTAAAPPGSATILTLYPGVSPQWQPNADVTILQHRNPTNMITVITPSATATAQLVTTPTEQRYFAGTAQR
ncbi:type VII secretion protein EccE [Nocardia sp. BMG111209]|uniref:type VII secretion protein EccE n=1 Tax=Nocardia sp. BMG111209 TaxID=1160137 RepID=UPI00037B6576|nr:type VII secretion protein EccE [Nocardia sp. BMG111209]